ncbi:restriction endonuclease subunit S [Algoriphagus persicinus]|uniref:restriction endonuclease subunit S n=1 Tax=Algoriphagus persicinus TaxID=3108754 RepID=UPI002B397452|nr:restriction endonuclease subunit S [Algoriphagus sp. E1-3-M2]MEB2786510.1 restriction endonuclease subunit S [Algoriphagus sp. E1-3-M2]
MKNYESYKDSGVDWIGEIPKSWSSSRLKFISSIEKGRIPSVTFQDQEKDMVPYLSMDYLRGNTESPEYVKTNDPKLIPVDLNDLLVLWDGSKAGEIVKAKPGALSSTMGKIHISDTNFDISFLSYFLKSAERYLQENTVGMGIPHVNGTILRSLFITKPSKTEQSQIARYLDHQTAIIDELIQRKKKLVLALEAKRKSVINEAVTKGLNPNVRMKDSGIDWIGEIPEHWVLAKLKYLVSMKSGNTITSDTIEDFGDYPVYGGNGLRGYTSNFTNEGNFVLIGRQGALCGNINYAGGKFWASEHAVVVYPILYMDTFYLGELLRLMNLNQYSESAAQPGISVGKILNLIVPKISFQEQIDISYFIKNKTEKIDSLNSKIQEQLVKLKEYRQSLISEVVTGKIDVRDWEINN